MKSFEDILEGGRTQFGEELGEFVWSFNHGDNIIYNFRVLVELYRSKNGSSKPTLLNKPITIILVSLIEAVLIDFLTRIDKATTHLPGNVDRLTLNKIKSEIAGAKKPQTRKDDFGEHIFMRRKMYQYGELLGIFERYELFGKTGDNFYRKLREFGELRNRVHIENYHGNFERKEYKVFTGNRLEGLESTFAELWHKMVSEYKRPWNPVETSTPVQGQE